eukprot:244895_1
MALHITWTLCESQLECPDIPSVYFNQEVVSNQNASDGTELLLILTSFFAGFAILFIAFVVFTLCKNRTSDSKYHKPLKLIIIMFTILIETFDILTDIAQVHGIYQGVKCGVTFCVKQDRMVSFLMIPCIIIGALATVISLHSFCRSDSNKYKSLDRCSEHLKLWGENIPMIVLVLYWMFLSGGAFENYSFISTTTFVSICVTAVNFYWIALPILCSCCCCCCCGDDADEYEQDITSMEQDIPNQIEITSMEKPVSNPWLIYDVSKKKKKKTQGNKNVGPTHCEISFFKFCTGCVKIIG